MKVIQCPEDLVRLCQENNLGIWDVARVAKKCQQGAIVMRITPEERAIVFCTVREIHDLTFLTKILNNFSPKNLSLS